MRGKETLFQGRKTENGDWAKGNLVGKDVVVPLGAEFAGSITANRDVPELDADEETIKIVLNQKK